MIHFFSGVRCWGESVGNGSTDWTHAYPFLYTAFSKLDFGAMKPPE